MTELVPLKTGLTRVFVIEDRARVDHSPNYQFCMRMDALTQSFGDIEKIECPDPNRPGHYIEVGRIRGASDRPTTTLEARYALNIKSLLQRLALKGCAFDIHLHMGECEDLSNFDQFQKVLIFEDAQITTYNTDALGSLQQDDESPVNENVDVSGREFYEIVPLTFSEKAGSLVTNEVVDMVFCGNVACGECGDENDGCDVIVAVTVAAGGSPSTPADIVYSIDGGTTWYAHDIDTMTASDDASGVACPGDNVVVVSNDTDSLHYMDQDELDGVTDPTWTEVSTGFVAAGSPNAIWAWGREFFVVGDGGYVYHSDNPADGVTVLDAGTTTSDILLDVHGLSTNFVVAVGQNGAIVYTEDGENFLAPDALPVGAGVHLNAVWVRTEYEWWVGTNGGQLFYTLNKGKTWTEKTFTGSGSGVVRDIAFSSPNVGYFSHDTGTPRGRIFRTINGGHTWTVMPRATGTLPLSDRFTALATCEDDKNLVVAGGLGDDGSDGIIVLGS